MNKSSSFNMSSKSKFNNFIWMDKVVNDRWCGLIWLSFIDFPFVWSDISKHVHCSELRHWVFESKSDKIFINRIETGS